MNKLGQCVLRCIHGFASVAIGQSRGLWFQLPGVRVNYIEAITVSLVNSIGISTHRDSNNLCGAVVQ